MEKIMKNLRLTILFAMLVAIGLVFTPSAWGVVCFHGIALQKNAVSPVQVGNQAAASYLIVNVDQAGDSLDVGSLDDTIFASGGNVNSGNILHALTWHFTGGAFFVIGGPSDGQLRMPPGSTATSDPFSFYTTVVGDFFLPNHVLPDQAVISWHDTCDANSGCTNCATDIPNTANAPGQTTVTALLPCVKVTKTADCDVATVGKLITYTIKVENCGPNPLTKDSITDTLLGSLSGCNTLDVNQSCTITATRTILANDADPLVNDVNVNYHDEFNQKASSTASASVDIIDPNFTVTKTCTSKPIPAGGPATFNVAIHNTGNIDLIFTTNEAAQSDTPEPFTVAVGAIKNITISILTDGTVNVNNTIIVTGNVNAQLVCPIPDIVKTSNLVTCFPFPTIDVNKVASCEAATVGQVITYTITIKNTGADTLNLVSVSDTILGDLTATAISHGCGTLAGGAQCSFTVNHTIQPGDTDPLVNLVAVDFMDSQSQHATDSATATVDIVHPDFTVTKTCTSQPIPAGGPATFDVVVTNIGDVNLSFTTNEAAQSSLAEPFTVVKNGGSQTFTITIPTSGTVDVPNTIQVTATLLNEAPCVEFTTNNQRTASDTCKGTPPGLATRTWGFWKTHTTFTECVFDKCGSSFDLGWRLVNSYADLFGIFEADNAKNSDGTKRCALGQARVTASKQALAALLNTCLDNGKPLPAGITPCSIKNTLTCGTVAEIKALNNQLDKYNNSGDTIKLASTEPCVQGSATPKASDAAANIPFADTTGGSDCTPSTNCPTCP